MRFQDLIGNMNVSGLKKCINDMATGHVCQLDSCNCCKIMGKRCFSIYTYLLSSNYSYTTNYYTINSWNIRRGKKKKKAQEKIKSLLDHIVGNFGALLATFQESINNLKSMDRNFATLLDKF